jgi:hypothetical protein
VIDTSIFGWSATPVGLRGERWRLVQSLRSKGLRHEVGGLAQTVTRTFDLDDDRVVKKPVQESRGHDGITKDLSPFRKAAIGGEDHGAFFVACVDELEEQISAPLTGR